MLIARMSFVEMPWRGIRSHQARVTFQMLDAKSSSSLRKKSESQSGKNDKNTF